MSLERSILSASCPEVAEKTRNGMMKIHPITKPAVLPSPAPHWAAWYVASSVKANLKRLSFAAPRNWVQKSGAKRRWPRSSNWLWSLSLSMEELPGFEHGIGEPAATVTQ